MYYKLEQTIYESGADLLNVKIKRPCYGANLLEFKQLILRWI